MALKKKPDQSGNSGQDKKSEPPKKVEQPKETEQCKKQAQSKTPEQLKKLEPCKKLGQSKTSGQPKIPEQPKKSKHLMDSEQSTKPEQKLKNQEQEKPKEVKKSEQAVGQLGPQTASCQALIRTACPQYLTSEEFEQIIRQFKICPWLENKQVLWSGLMKDQVQEWAAQRGMQTLTTAMGPLMDSDNPLCLRQTKSSCAWSKYIKGASLVFAWRISQGSYTTVLTPPPPERFHPDGLTNWQDIEEPVLKGRLGTPTSCAILLVHPAVQEAQNFRYQVWPVDYTDKWLKKFKVNQASIHTWRTISKSRGQFLYYSMFRCYMMADQSTAHTSWMVPTDEPLKSADTIKLSTTRKANAVTLASTASRDNNASADPRCFLQSQVNMPEIGFGGEKRLVMPQVTKVSGTTMSPPGPTLSPKNQQSRRRVGVDAATQTIQVSFPGSQIVNVSSDEALPPASGGQPQCQKSMGQTKAGTETRPAVPKVSQVSNDAITSQDRSDTPQSLPNSSRARANQEAIQLSRPGEPATGPSSAASITEAPSAFLVCLYLAIIEIILSLLLLLIGTAVHLGLMPWNRAKMSEIKTPCPFTNGGSASQAIPVNSKAAKKASKKASKRFIKEQSLREAQEALESAVAIGRLFHEDKLVDEPQAASVDTSSTLSNFSAPTITVSGMDFASHGLPGYKRKDKNKRKKATAVASITAEDAQVTAFTQPTREYAHSCLGPVDPSALRKSYWVD
ncbi:hypothetical protein CMEL01_14786 [Colletotrichum melonis]|uniref:Uncharacterized protein n=1 Tax=Colletotrichum melonis TaxID=1209925 RepID=A0AAI9UQT4_9PEZI|nr:hypothetical protein CMEL01_14786 [Colletotrichum melonis]